MKVIAFNGSPNQEGNTFQAIKMVVDELVREGIETEIIHVGNQTISGCTACGQCIKNMNEQCVLPGDNVNAWINKMKNADGIILGSPVHFSAIGGAMKSFLDRAFFVAGVNKSMLRHKVGASVVAVRRSGGLPAFNQLNNFLCYAEMLMPTSNYWNVIHGFRPGEVTQDAEGVQIMRVLGKNMSYLMKLVENGRGKVDVPERESKILTNFIH